MGCTIRDSRYPDSLQTRPTCPSLRVRAQRSPLAILSAFNQVERLDQLAQLVGHPQLPCADTLTGVEAGTAG